MTRTDRLVLTGLLALAAVPVVAGSLRLAEFAGAAAVLPDGARIGSAAGPITLHIVSVTLFSLVGAVQFAPGVRARHRCWHRRAGRVLIVAGLLTALSGLWLNLFLPPAPNDSAALVVVRVVVAVWLGGSLVLGFQAIRRRDVRRHRAWMIRGYAIAMGAGTQFVTQATWLAAVGPLTTGSRFGTMTIAWLINAAVAEWIIRRGRVSAAFGQRTSRVTPSARAGSNSPTTG